MALELAPVESERLAGASREWPECWPGHGRARGGARGGEAGTGEPLCTASVQRDGAWHAQGAPHKTRTEGGASPLPPRVAAKPGDGGRSEGDYDGAAAEAAGYSSSESSSSSSCGSSGGSSTGERATGDASPSTTTPPREMTPPMQRASKATEAAEPLARWSAAAGRECGDGEGASTEGEVAAAEPAVAEAEPAAAEPAVAAPAKPEHAPAVVAPAQFREAAEIFFGAAEAREGLFSGYAVRPRGLYWPALR